MHLLFTLVLKIKKRFEQCFNVDGKAEFSVSSFISLMKKCCFFLKSGFYGVDVYFWYGFQPHTHNFSNKCMTSRLTDLIWCWFKIPLAYWLWFNSFDNARVISNRVIKLNFLDNFPVDSFSSSGICLKVIRKLGQCFASSHTKQFCHIVHLQ